MINFIEALEAWKARAQYSAGLRIGHEIAYAKALTASQGKNEAARKGEADIATVESRTNAEKAEIDERAAYHLMIHLRGAGAVEGERAV